MPIDSSRRDTMDKYLKGNLSYWQKGYEAENVESFVFRPYGRILKFEFGLDGSGHEKLLDFGCGAGAALKFFKSKGFDAYGIDISKIDIQRCKEKMPDIAEHFQIINSKPKSNQIFFGGNFDIIIAVQSLYYLSNKDLENALMSLWNNMKPGAIIYATMMGTKHYMYKYSKKYKDGLRKIDFSLPRITIKNYFVNFTASKKELIEKFHIFKKCHVGYYDAKYREDEGCRFHYTFVGQKT